MSFLNAMLAFGALAFVIPLAIHLLFRNRFETIDWGAMYLLGEAIDANRRRFQLSDLLLLILRCAIPILLAVCLARPVFHQFSSLPGDAPQTFVLVVDDSRSMSATEPNDVVRIEKAKQQLSQFLETQSRRDEVMLVLGSRAGEVVPKMGIDEAIRRIHSISADAQAVDVGSLVSAGAEAALDASHSLRQVVIVSDFQSNIVDDAAIASVDSTAAAIKEKTMPSAYRFWNIAEHTDQLRNLSVDSVEADVPVVVVGRKIPLDARIRNASDVPVRDLRVVWSVDGEPAQMRTIDLEPRSSATSRSYLTFDHAGAYHVDVAIENDDSLSADNHRGMLVDVLTQVNVLLVSGDPNSKPLKGETDFLAIALSPFSFGSDDRPDPIRTEVLSDTKFAQQVRDDDVNLSDHDVIVLANVKQIDAALRNRMATYVNDGGALVLFDGERVEPSSYNEPWGNGESKMPLPAQMGEVVAESRSEGAEPFRIGHVDSQYTPLRAIVGDDREPLRSVGISAYRRLLPLPTDSQDVDGARTLISLVGGDPLVVHRDFGAGQIAQFAIPCDADWSTLPLRPVFVPMVHQIVMDLAGSSEVNDNDSDEVSAAESELRDVNEDRLSALAQSLGGDVYRNVQSIQDAEQIRRFGREIWRWILFVLLVALVAEVLIQRRRSSAPVATGAA